MCDSNSKEQKENNLKANENNVPNKTSLNIERNVEIDENLNQVNSTIKPTKQRKWVKCDLCNVPLSSKNSVQRHITGKRHLANIKRITERHFEVNIKLFCETCKLKTNSLKQMEDHLKSNKHKGRLEMIARRKQLRSHCLYGIFIASFIFAILITIFYAMFIYVQSL